RVDAAIEVRKRKIAVGYVGCVACLVLPSLEVHGPGPADTQKNSQDLQIGYLLSQGRVQAAAALLDEREVESCRVRNRLQMVGDVAIAIQDQIAIVQRNGRMLSLGKVRDGVLESCSEVGVGCRAAVPRPPGSVYG